MQTAGCQHRVVTHLPVGLNLSNLFRRWVFQLSHLGLPASAQHNIGTTTRHVGGDGYRCRITCLRNNIRFFGVEFGVQYVVLDARFRQLVRNHFGFFNGDGPHQNRLAFSSTLANVFDDRLNFFRFGHVHQVWHILTDHRTVGWNDHGIQLVDRAEFKRFGIGCTGHARQLLVQTEVVLEGDRRQRLVFVLNIHAFFGFYSLVQTVRPATSLHGTTGVLIDNDHFAVFYDVVDVAGEQRVGTQRGGHMVHQHDVARRVQRLALFHNAFSHQQLFDFHQTTLGQVHLARFFIHGEVTFTLEGIRVFFLLAQQVWNDFVDLTVHLGAVFSRAGDDKRSTRFIDQDGVHLIHQRVVQLTLDALFRAERHVVTQVVEAVFVVGTVGNVRVIRFTLGWCRQARHVDADGHAEEFEQWTVVFGVTLRQIVVDGNDVNAFTGQRIQVSRQRCGQGFTFTGTHFRDAAFVKHHPTQQLNVEVTHAEHALTCFTHDRKCFRDQAF